MRRTRFATVTLAGMLAAAAAMAQPGPPPGGGGGAPGNSGDGIWRRNAYWGEIQTFDACVGHQPGSGDYHHHANPVCLRAELGDNVELVRNSRTGPAYKEKAGPWKHSPILGWANDGYPVYGPYGYTDPRNSASPVRRLRSGYRLRNITERTSLPDWSLPNHPGVSRQLSASQYGPAVTALFPLGRYLEDFEHVAGTGELDQYNGRFEVTPEFPNGTYAYHIAIGDDGSPAFPYILGGQLYGTIGGGRAQNVPSGVQDYFNSGTVTPAAGTPSPSLTSWMVQSSDRIAQVVSGFDPSAGPATTWPGSVPQGFRTTGGVTVPAKANVQRVRYDDASVYINANGLGAYQMGPWFDPTMTGGIFSNFPASQNYQYRIPRAPSEAASKSASTIGPQGVWVNGVPVFNFLDGSSYSNANKDDSGGGNVRQTAIHISSASAENGPAAPGSLVTGYSLFGTALATSEAAAPTPSWPNMLGTTQIAVRDAAGVSRPAELSWVSPAQVNFRVPAESASGAATVIYNVGGNTFNSGIFIVPTYPNLFTSNSGQAAGYVTRVRNGLQAIEPLDQPVALTAGEEVYLVVYGSGLGNAGEATARIGGVEAPVIYAGPQGTWKGLDQFNIQVPAPLAGKGRVELVVTAAGRPSNAVTVEFR